MPSSLAVSAGTDALSQLRSAASEASALLRAMANETRLLLLCQLLDGEHNVGELESLTGIGQPTLSQQLGVLRDEGLVTPRREGKFVYYRLASDAVVALMRALYEIYCAPANGRSTRNTGVGT